jgi:hypothetical protein
VIAAIHQMIMMMIGGERLRERGATMIHELMIKESRRVP